MSHATLDPKKTVVLYFDMLNQYHKNDEPLVQNCARLRAAADEAGIPWRSPWRTIARTART